MRLIKLLFFEEKKHNEIKKSFDFIFQIFLF